MTAEMKSLALKVSPVCRPLKGPLGYLPVSLTNQMLLGM